MNELIKEIKKYIPAMYLDRLGSRRSRRVIRVFFLAIVSISGIAFLLFKYIPWLVASTSFQNTMFSNPDLYLGVFLISFSILTTFYLLSFFYNTLFFRGLDSIISEKFNEERGITFEVARILYKNQDDLTYGFFSSQYARMVMYRAGLNPQDVQDFLNRRDRVVISVEKLKIPEKVFVSLQDLGMYIHQNDNEFHQFVLNHGKNDAMFQGALSWVSRSYLIHKYRTKWWSRDNLGKTGGLGRGLSFGVAYELQKFMKPITSSAVFSVFSNDSSYADDLVQKIETSLSSTKAANVMLVGEPGVGKMDILIEVARRTHNGKSASSVMGKQIIVFDSDSFVATHNTKEEFEIGFFKLLSQAEKAGNIIVVIENISSFVASAESLGSNIVEFLDRFLVSPSIQIIVTSDLDSYHSSIERKSQFMSRFEPVMVENPTLDSTIRVLEDVAETHENGLGVFFTYPAIAAVAEDADRYIVEGVMPDKAVSLLSDVVANAQSDNVKLITKEYTERTVAKKTGVPIGPVNEVEKEKLLNLEDLMHQRVVGQHSAIKAIASALRRSRAGIQTKDRPLGTFLFLGSTGVGKTETAKALAEVFFDSEDNLMRLDMTEYSDFGALRKLIGSANESGSLPSLLRTNPYGVLLLDEFEKASTEIHDMFLQILDEGVFTDGNGKKVNARNIIFIATSNAGSDLIWNMTSQGKDPGDAKDEIVDSIIKRSVLKPELINRFDSVVIFKTLQETEQRDIARLMLDDLVKRIDQKGYKLNVTNGLVDVLVEKGFDPEFGARPMRRVLQDLIEEKIASKIISGNLQYGDEIVFTKEDFSEQSEENLQN